MDFYFVQSRISFYFVEKKVCFDVELLANFVKMMFMKRVPIHLDEFHPAIKKQIIFR
jgi:hypothetical protein